MNPLKCQVTGEEVKTNKPQFRHTAEIYGVTPEQLREGYVSRTGRNILRDLTVAEAKGKYPTAGDSFLARYCKKEAPPAERVVESDPPHSGSGPEVQEITPPEETPEVVNG